MNKFTIPAILVVTVLVAGIFAFMPVEKVSTVHTTIQGTQLNEIDSKFFTDVGINSTASCSTAADFLVFFTFSNDTFTAPPITDRTTKTALGIVDLSTDTVADIAVTLLLGNQTSISGVIGGTAGETITFFGNSTENTGGISQNDVGDLALTVICQSGNGPTITP